MDETQYKDEDYVALVNKLKIDRGDVLIFRIPRKFNPPPERLEDLMRYVRKHGGYVLFVAKDIEIEKLPEDKMEKMGWVRKNANSKD